MVNGNFSKIAQFILGIAKRCQKQIAEKQKAGGD